MRCRHMRANPTANAVVPPYLYVYVMTGEISRQSHGLPAYNLDANH